MERVLKELLPLEIKNIVKKIEEIKLMNETMINYLRDKGLDIKRNEIIKQILQDEACFLMSKEDLFKNRQRF